MVGSREPVDVLILWAACEHSVKACVRAGKVTD